MKFELLLVISSWFCNSLLLAQVPSDEQILNIILEDRENKGCDSILLLKDKAPIFFYEGHLNEMKSKLPIDIVDDLIRNNSIKRKSITLWNIEQVNKAKGVTNKDSLNRSFRHELEIADSLFIMHYSLDTISDLNMLNNVIDSLWNEGISSSDFFKYSHCYHYTTICSYPVFSSNGKYVIMELTNYKHGLNAAGKVLIYKRKRNKWKYFGYFGSWVS